MAELHGRCMFKFLRNCQLSSSAVRLFCVTSSTYESSSSSHPRQHFEWSTCQISRAAVTNGHKLGGLKQKNVYSHRSGGQNSQIKVSTGLVPPGGSQGGCFLAFSGLRWPQTFLGLWRHHSKLCLSFCGICLCVTLFLTRPSDGHQSFDLGSALIQYDLALTN